MSKAGREKERFKSVAPARPLLTPDTEPGIWKIRTDRYGWLLPLFLALSVNANALLNDFTWDDKILFVDQADPAQKPAGPAPIPGVYYRPLITWSYNLDRAIWGLNPFGFHLSVYLAHALAVLFVYFIAVSFLRLYQYPKEKGIALVTASLFAVHPIHSEAVAWISGRNDVFMALFLLVAFYAYLRYRQGTAAWVALPVFALGAVLGLLSKETAIPFLFIFPVCDFLFHHAGILKRQGIKDPATWIWIAAWVSFALYRLSHVEMPSAHREAAASLGNEIMTFFSALGYYLKLLFLPYPLNLFVHKLPVGNLLALYYLALGTAGVAVLLWIAVKKSRTLFAVGAAWFVLGMAAPLVVPLAKVAVTPVAERYTYLASGGFLLLVGLGGFEVRRWVQAQGGLLITARWVLMSLGLAVGLLSCLTIERNGVWRNEITLWEDAVRKSPEAVLPHYNLGIAYGAVGRREEAVQVYQAALKLDPAHSLAHNNLGNLYKEMGRFEEAVQEYQSAMKLQPDHAGASAMAKPHNNLGVVYKEMGRFEEAVREFQAAMQLQPNSANPRFNLGAVYEELGRLDEAIHEYRSGLEINPSDALAHKKLADVLSRKGRTEEAEKEYQVASTLQPTVQKPQPDSAVSHYNRGTSLSGQGRLDEAVAEFQTAIRLDPNYQNAHYNLGLAYANQGKFNEAIAEFQTVVRLKPDDPSAHAVLGDIYKDQGKLNETMVEYQTVLRLDPNQVEVHYNLGQVYGRAGRLEDAKKQYQQALQLQPDFSAARKALEFLPR
ncbi:MAG: tetratricopeptide repeat protein [Nitrospirae bacterium]|nr:tetratricopeptide repeat protein [Nitrospirota bacterium]